MAVALLGRYWVVPVKLPRKNTSTLYEPAEEGAVAVYVYVPSG